MLNFCQQFSYVMEHTIGIQRLSQKQKDLAQTLQNAACCPTGISADQHSPICP
jgi:hypothetical protein